MAVGDGAQRAADAGLLEEYARGRHHDGRDDGGRDVDLLQVHEAAEHLELDRAAREIEILGDHHLGLAAEHDLPEPDQHVGQPERRHEQDDVGLIDQRPQHDALDRDGEHEHHADGEAEREEGREIAGLHAPLAQQRVEADQRQRGEHHHDALREVEYAGRLEDQHEAERDQRIENARDQPLPQRLHQQVRRRAHLHERVDEDLVEEVHYGAPRSVRSPPPCGEGLGVGVRRLGTRLLDPPP